MATTRLVRRSPSPGARTASGDSICGALPHAEVDGAIEAVRASDASGVVKLALEFLVLTAARSGEVRLATWQEMDLEAREWTLAPERMKSNRAHRVPLSGRAMEILRQARGLGGPPRAEAAGLTGTAAGP